MSRRFLGDTDAERQPFRRGAGLGEFPPETGFVELPSIQRYLLGNGGGRAMTRGALAFLLIATVFPLVSAKAGGVENDFLAHIVGPLDKHGSFFACFTRQYDDSHLAAHPNQRVTFAKALVDAHY